MNSPSWGSSRVPLCTGLAQLEQPQAGACWHSTSEAVFLPNHLLRWSIDWPALQ